MRCARVLTVASMAGAIAGLFMPAETFAQSRWVYSITSPAELERDSNPTMSASGSTPVTRVRLSPDLHALYRSGRNELEIAAGMDLERSSDEDISANRNDPRMRADWRFQTATAALGLYIVGEQRAYRAVDVIEQVPLGVDGTRTLGAVGATWSTNISEKSSIGAELREDWVRFDTPPTADYRLTTANAQLLRSITEVSSWFLSANAQSYRPESSGRQAAPVAKSDSYGLVVGYRGDINEVANWEASAGPVRLNGTSASTEWQGSITASYKLSRLQANFNASRRPTVASADSELGMSIVLGLQFHYALDALSSLTAEINASRTEAQTPSQASNFTVAYARQLSPFWTFAIRPQLRHRSDNTGSARAHVLALTITYSHPDL